MDEIRAKVNILSRDINLINMGLWEINLREIHVDLNKRFAIESKLDIAGKALADALKILGWGSVNEIEKQIEKR